MLPISLFIWRVFFISLKEFFPLRIKRIILKVALSFLLFRVLNFIFKCLEEIRTFALNRLYFLLFNKAFDQRRTLHETFLFQRFIST